ncbi:MAG: VCBS repeat-containing protein [Archangium sp.]|nr:VCBS repeat-containing protein [Archangium sp.]
MLVLALILAASPNIAQLDAQEELNDALEARFDGLCRALKASGGRAPKTHVEPPSLVEPKLLRLVRTCSFRALALSGPAKQKTARILWEFDGLTTEGERVTERGEADATLTLKPSGWTFTRFDDARRDVVRRPAARFSDVAAESGLQFPTSRTGHLLLGGLAVRDLNGDGRLDVAATDGTDVVVFTQDQPLHFTSTVISTGHPKMWTSSITAADFDDDGDADLLVTHHPGPTELFRNENGTFALAGTVGEAGQWHSAITADLDQDGHLDVVLLPYPLEGSPTNPLEAANGFPLQLFRGDGKLAFTRWHQEVAFPKRWALSAVAADLLAQGRPQLYVANDYGSNDLWRFEADGGAMNVAASSGLNDPGNGMSADVADFDGDGQPDLYISNMFSKAGTRVIASAKGLPPELMGTVKKFARGNTLYLSRDGGFDEQAEPTGVNRGLWAFGSVMTDFDNDGRLDVAVANGYLSHPNRKDS